DSGDEQPQGRPPVKWVWTGVISLIVVVLAVGFWLFKLSPGNIVPENTRVLPNNVFNMTEKAGSELLEGLGFVVKVEKQETDDVEPGRIFAADPAIGATVERGATVKLFVSSGPKSKKLPDLTNESLETAKKKLEELGLVVGQIEKKDAPRVKADTVLEMSPKAGQTAQRGEKVTLTVASGFVDVPDVKGQALEAARLTLSGAGVAFVTEPRNCAITADKLPIIEQSAVGKQAQDTPVKIFYCIGVTPSYTPEPPTPPRPPAPPAPPRP
ncbi:MAG: PASTA domain-containing protein, partial [Microbacteriaceae bacterium]|nr:PASTA domain-containing protein [Microbacteriaceae bacterium]